MAAAVQQPMSANPQSFHHYATYSATGPVMSNSYSSSSPSTTSAPPPHPAPPPLVPSHDFAEQSQAPAHLAFASSYHPAPSPALAKRRSSKGKLPLDLIKRSSSTPQMRNLAAVEGDSMSPTTDKKRNKLGYHRTSVACGKNMSFTLWSFFFFLIFFGIVFTFSSTVRVAPLKLTLSHSCTTNTTHHHHFPRKPQSPLNSLNCASLRRIRIVC